MINVEQEKIVRAIFVRGDQARCKAVYRTDRGRVCVIEGLDLPPAYQVHWHTQLMGAGAIPMWGSSDGVVIPDALLDTGKTVYGWIYINDESAGVTIKSIVIPVQERPTADGVAPDPQEASIIEQAVNALNEAVERTQEIADGIPDAIDEALTEAKESGEFDGKDGKDGQDGQPGRDGQDGAPGQPGADGFSPIATVTRSGDTVTITITDAQGTTSGSMTEQDALHLIADDYSESAYYPQNAIVVHDGGLYLRIESTVGHGAWVAADWMESNMSDILAAREDAIYNAIGRMAARLLPQGGTTGQVLTKASGTDFDATWTTPQGGGVSDVQVNGTSVVSGGVANVTPASDRVTSLNGTKLTGTTVEAVGIPVYVSNPAEYSEYTITETGWYIFARIHAPDGVTMWEYGYVADADGAIITIGGDHVDVAIRFTVAATSRTIGVSWAEDVYDVFVFKATDLAVRNLDYRTTFYVYDLAPFVTWTYDLTTDATFVAGSHYYTESGGVYTEAVEGTDWTAGEAVPADTYYKHSKLHIEGMARNVTYQLDTPVDCPSEIVLPAIEDDGTGAWFEMRFRHTGSFSSTLLPQDETVKVATEHTQAETAGMNMVDLHYMSVGGVKIWRFMNTHSTIPT